jgi:hypothetical protein
MAGCTMHGSVLIVSALAAIAGLVLLGKEVEGIDDIQGNEESLMRMVFSYWLVYCAMATLCKLHLIPSQWEGLLIGLRLTKLFAYMLTASCVFALPLHRFASFQEAKEYE